MADPRPDSPTDDGAAAWWDLSSELMVVFRVDGSIEAANAAWSGATGWSPENLVGTDLFDLVHPDEQPRVRKLAAFDARGRAIASLDLRLRHVDGRYRWLRWSARGDGNRVRAVGRDVTHEKEQAEALRDLEDFRRLAFAGVGGVGVWTYEVKSDRFFCDEIISRLYDIDAVQGAQGILRRDFLANVHEEDRASLGRTMSGGLVNAGDLELEYRLVHADGSIHWVLSRGHTYFDDNGLPVRRTGVGIDLTRQRLLEEQLRQSQKLEAIGQLTGGIAHDFNNLLTVIRTSIDLLQRSADDPARRQRFMDSIASATVRAGRLTGQLLAFARQQTLQPVEFDAGENVAAVSNMIQTLSGARIEIAVELSPEPCFVRADPSQFDTALVNLAVNARDAMPEGGRLVLKVAKVSRIPPTRGQAALDGRFVAVSVVDTGTGIDAAHLDKIFEPFYTTKAPGQGTGLGLSQVIGFAKQSGGEIEVRSERGAGSSFTLYLPSAPAVTPVGGPAPVATAPATSRRLSILLVEDNAEVARSIESAIGFLGHACEWVPGGDEALSRLEAGAADFDVVFSDVVMPGMDGIELAREIARLHPRLPVVLSTAYSHVLASDGEHGFDVLRKPFAVDDLAATLQRVTDRARAQAAESAPGSHYHLGSSHSDHAP